MTDAFAAEFVARFDDALVGDEFQRLLATGFTHRVERLQDDAGGFASAVERRGEHGDRLVHGRVRGNVCAGRLGHATASVGEVEIGQALVKQMIGVVYLAMTDEMDGGRAHSASFPQPDHARRR